MKPDPGKAAVLGILVGTAGLLLNLATVGSKLEESAGLDFLFKVRGTRRPPGEVIIVSLDKSSADHLSLPPDPRRWPRSLHTRLVRNLASQGAEIIVFDVLFEESRASGEDAGFAEALKEYGKVVLCSRLKSDLSPLPDARGSPVGDYRVLSLAQPIPSLANAALAIAPFPLPKVPVKVSSYWSFQSAAGYAPTLPVVALFARALPVHDDFVRLATGAGLSEDRRPPAGTMKKASHDSLVKTIGWWRETFTADEDLCQRLVSMLAEDRRGAGGEGRRLMAALAGIFRCRDKVYLNFYGPAQTIKTIPYHQALESPSETAREAFSRFRGKTVFVGLSENLQPEQKDGYYTVFSRADGLDLSGVEIAATAFANLLEGRPVRPATGLASATVVFCWGLAVGLISFLLPGTLAALCVAGLAILYLLVSLWQFGTAGLWLPLVIPLVLQAPLGLMTAVSWKYTDMSRERRTIKKSLSLYLPASVLDRLAEDMAGIKSDGQCIYGICLGTDAEQYTAISESMDPLSLGRLMDRYYEVIFKPIELHGGGISNVIADSMLALWGSTNPDVSLRENACLAALDIARALETFNQSLPDIKLPNGDKLQLPTRIGIHCGALLVGSIGGGSHYEYRPVGDVVNTATRIEGMNKYLGTKILASEEVVDQLDQFLTREIGKFLVVGKSRPVVVHELVCRLTEAGDRKLSVCAHFRGALTAFRSRSWHEAENKFRQVIQMTGGDGPSAFYLPLCLSYQGNPPGESWDGAIKLERK